MQSEARTQACRQASIQRVVTPNTKLNTTTTAAAVPNTSQAVDLVSHALLDDLQRQYLQTREKIEAFSYYGRGKIDQLENALQQQQQQYEELQHEHESTIQTLQRVRGERDAARKDLSKLTRKTVSLQKRVQELEQLAARASAMASCGSTWTEYLCAWDIPCSKGFPEEDCDDEITAETDSTE
jgi:DNA repair exonuclease SbcCD ATPase subunit